MKRLGLVILAAVLAISWGILALAATDQPLNAGSQSVKGVGLRSDQGKSPLIWQTTFSPSDPRLYSLYTAVDLGNYNSPPNEPSNPWPADGAYDIVPPDLTFTWEGGDPDPGDTVTYTVGLGTDPGSLNIIASGLTEPTCSTSGLTWSTTYYWQVTAEDQVGATTEGPVWHFSTIAQWLTQTPTITIPPATATPTMTQTATVTGTATVSPTGTGTVPPTPTIINIEFDMGAPVFSSGDTCYLRLHTQNAGAEQTVDLYILLAYYGEYWCYPSWQHISMGIDYQTRTVTAGLDNWEYIIPEFTMPAVSAAGPFYFYGAMFETGYLDLDHLVSTGAVWEFYFE